MDTINNRLYMCQDMVLPVYFEGELRISKDCGLLVEYSVIWLLVVFGTRTRNAYQDRVAQWNPLPSSEPKCPRTV